jgi:hypothetical protein
MTCLLQSIFYLPKWSSLVECSSGKYNSQYKNDIGKCMVLLGIEEMETWATRKRAILDMLKKMEEYAHAIEAGNGEGSEPVNNQLRQLVLSKMCNRLDWRGMLSLCWFKKDMTVMQTGATCDIIEKAILKSNRLKLPSTMRMLGISELTGQWQYRQCQVDEKLIVIHRLHHVLSVVEYGLDYLESETLSCVENCIPCLLHCKKRVIDKIVRMFLLGRRKVL